MEGKKDLNLNDFMSNGWKYLKLLSLKSSIEINHQPVILNKKENLIQDDEYHINNETEKYEKYNVEAVKINELLFTEKTKIIIHGNLL